MTAHSIETHPGRSATPKVAVIAALVVLTAALAFALAFLVSHGGTPPAPPARVVDAKLKPGPTPAALKRAFAAEVAPLAKAPVKHHRKPAVTTPAATPSPVTSAPTADDTYTAPAPTYTPPAPAAPSTPTKKKSAPAGGGVITIG